MRDIKIGVLGTNQIQHIIPLLEQEYKVINIEENMNKKKSKIGQIASYIHDVFSVDIVYNVFTAPYFWKKAMIARLLQKKVITHWIGSDVRAVSEGRTDLQKIKKYVNTNISCFEPLQKQLRDEGLESSIIPIVPFKMNFDICEMPTEHSVLIYMPKNYEEYYGINEIKPVFKHFSNVRFYIIANDNSELFAEYANVEVLGRLSLNEMEQIYNRISIVLRIHINDGLSMSVIEALAKGKYVIWNYDYPFVLPGKTTDEIIASMDYILNEKPSIQQEAHKYICENLTKEKILYSYSSVFNEMMDKPRR